MGNAVLSRQDRGFARLPFGVVVQEVNEFHGYGRAAATYVGSGLDAVTPAFEPPSDCSYMHKHLARHETTVGAENSSWLYSQHAHRDVVAGSSRFTGQRFGRADHRKRTNRGSDGWSQFSLDKSP